MKTLTMTLCLLLSAIAWLGRGIEWLVSWIDWLAMQGIYRLTREKEETYDEWLANW